MRRCMQGGGSSTCAKMKPGAAQSRCVDMAQGSTYAMLWARTPALLGHLRRFASCCARRSQTRQLLLPQKLSRRSPVDLGEGSDHCPGAPQSKIRPRRAGSTARAAARALGAAKNRPHDLRRRQDAPGALEELPGGRASRQRDRGRRGGQLPTEQIELRLRLRVVTSRGPPY